MIFGFLSPTLAMLLFMVAYPFFSLIYYSALHFSALSPAQGSTPRDRATTPFLLSDTRALGALRLHRQVRASFA